jgi:3-keto-L-gulonate-6-phosphate decarboxylase
MKKTIKLTVAILVFGSVVYACKVKQQQSNLSPQKNQLSAVQEVDDETLVKMLSRNWMVNVVNYQADARKNVLYERGIDANLHDFSKESFKISDDEKVVYTDESGKKHHGTWDLKDNNTKLLMEFEDGQEVAWDIIEKGRNQLVLHLSIDAQKVKWDISNLNEIDIPTAAVFAGFYAGVVDERTERVNITYKMMPRS